MLEVLIVSNNKLTNLRKVESLPNLRVIDASGNNITSLHQEMLDMYSLDTIYLFGNPIVNQNPQLAKIEGNQGTIRKVFESYFGVSGGSAGGSLSSGFASMNLGSTSGIQSSTMGASSNSFNQSNVSSIGATGLQKPMSTSQALNASISSASFLQSEININDPAVLRKRIADLEMENKRLRESESGMGSSSIKGSGTLRMQGQNTGGVSGGGMDKDWMNFGSQPIERPTTASNSQKEKSLQEELKYEKKEKKHLMDEIENLKKELQKSNFSAFTQSSSAISVAAGRLPQVAGVREITNDDIEIGEQISQGGFSVIHKGMLNGTPVAFKKIFDPRLTDELLYEIYNEILM